MYPTFTNEPPTDFSRPDQRREMEATLAQVAAELGRDYPLIIGRGKIFLADKIPSLNPANPECIVGTSQRGQAAEVDRALTAAWQAFTSWKERAAEERAAVLFRAADLMRRRKFELAAWMICEVGKSWREADADVAEAIDFCEFYGREAIRFSAGQPTTAVPGEENRLFYIPLGAGAIIAPWNFPLAILTGMTTAAIVCGNTVVLKPAAETAIIAAKFMEVMIAAGLPAGVINLLTGHGKEAGEVLISDPRTRFISFTGSKEIGLHIVETAGRRKPGQRWVTRVMAEMGGKDTIIVDDECELDAAVEGVVLSTFGFQGQKCSACSRAVVTTKVHNAFLEKLKARVATITIGSPLDYKNFMGPVASRAQFDKVRAYLDVGKKEGKLLVGGQTSDAHGYFIHPTVFTDVAPTARLAQEEIFGPILAVIKACDFDAALTIANNTEYGLTGAVFSTNREKIERAKRAFFVGNLYINRKCTGALVDVQPFGGYHLSGTGAKAGGRDYLLHFLQGKSISEKL